jgi:hypothetical protein
MMDALPTSFTFKENILIRSVVSLFFGASAAVVAVACLIKVSDGVVWLVPGIAAIALTVVLLIFAFNSWRYRQVINISPRGITSRSPGRGEIEIPWYEVESISEKELKGENLRRAMPGVEIMISMYMFLPLASGTERRALFIIQGRDERSIVLRSHLIYPHRLDQLRHAVDNYAGRASHAMKMLKLNLNN